MKYDYEYSEYDYEILDVACYRSVQICPPDEFVTRHYELSLALAEFLLKPYHDHRKKQKENQ